MVLMEKALYSVKDLQFKYIFKYLTLSVNVTNKVNNVFRMLKIYCSLKDEKLLFYNDNLKKILKSTSQSFWLMEIIFKCIFKQLAERKRNKQKNIGRDEDK